MRLRDLNARLKGSVAGGALVFDCPFPACNRSHSVRVQISDAPYHERETTDPSQKVRVWQASGEFPDSITLTPSVDIIEQDEHGNKIRTRCWHGWIQNGEVT